MEGDVELLDHLFGSMEESVKRLEIAKNKNKPEEVSKIKKEILEIQKKISEEIR